MCEIMRCDGCGADIAKDTIFYCINKYAWDNDFQRLDIIGNTDDRDFCSLACVAKWCLSQPPPDRKKRRRR